MLKFGKTKSIMKTPLSVKSTLLCGLFILSSCGTIKFSDDVKEKQFGDLQTGRMYSFKLKNAAQQKMVFSRLTDSEIIGFANKRDSTIVTVAKDNVLEARDTKKSTVVTVASVIGAAAAGALVISSLRADDE